MTETHRNMMQRERESERERERERERGERKREEQRERERIYYPTDIILSVPSIKAPDSCSAQARERQAQHIE